MSMKSLLTPSFLFVKAVASFVPNQTLKTRALQRRGQAGRAAKDPAPRVKRLLEEFPVPCVLIKMIREGNSIEDLHCQHHHPCKQDDGAVRCFRSMMTYAQDYRYNNSHNGMILFRGGKSHEMEKSTFFRGSSITNREKSLRRLLEMTVLLQSYYEEEANHYKDGADMFDSRDLDSIVATIRVMALLQQYGDLVENLATPMLEAYRDLRVAASFAFQGGGGERAVRVLLVPIPYPVDRLSKTLWSEKNTRDASYLIRRLGKSDMLLVELEGLPPASAVRSQSQSGYILVHEQDVKDFHELRRQHGKKIMEQFLFTEEAKDLRRGSNDLDYLDLRISNDVTFEDFFDAHPGEKVNPFPGLLKEQLYPERDPMADIIREVATRLSSCRNNSGSDTVGIETD